MLHAALQDCQRVNAHFEIAGGYTQHSYIDIVNRSKMIQTYYQLTIINMVIDIAGSIVTMLIINHSQ